MKVIKEGRMDKVVAKEHIICSNCEAILEFTELEKLNYYQIIGCICQDTGLKYVICVECGFEIIL